MKSIHKPIIKINNFRCKFCNKLSKTFEVNIKHMKLYHVKEYDIYINNLNEYNSDIKKLDASNIMNLSNVCININNSINNYDTEQEDDPELTFIENNKLYNNVINNLDLFADIAISYSKKKN